MSETLDLDAIAARYLGDSSHIGRTVGALLDEINRLRSAVNEYENCITWDVTCSGCARHLDIAIAEHERADRAVDAIRRVLALCESAERWFPSSFRPPHPIYPSRIRKAIEATS